MKWLALTAALLGSTVAVADIAPPDPAPVKPEGRIEGGWGYVYACYALAVGGSALYALSLYLRRPGTERRGTP